MNIPEGYKKTEIGIIPNNWKIKKIIDCAEYADYRGKTPRKTESGRFLVTAKNIREGFIDYEISQEFVAEDEYELIMRRGKPRIGDILITTEAPVGNVAIVDREDVALAQRVIKYRAKNDILNKDYFKHYLLGQQFQKIVDAHSSGTTAKGIKGSVLHQLPIIFPPLPEQKAIAQSLSDVDALIAECDRLITKKRNIKQGTMQQLLTGKKRLPGFSGEWEVKKLGEIVDIDSDNLKSDTSPSYSFKYISLEDVERGILKNVSYCLFSSAPSRARRKVQKNDILVATVRPNLKSHLFVKFEISNLICSTGFYVIRCNPARINSQFIYHHFFANIIEQQFNKLLVGSNYPAVNSSDIKNLEIPLPTVEEQKAIAQILSDMDAEIEALEQKRDKYKAIKQSMMQELLTGKTRLITNC